MNLMVSDRSLLELLGRQGGMSVAELIEALGVTATAVRQRLDRLTAAKLIDRVEVRSDAGSRGRPAHQYVLTGLGRESLGNNLNDLARAIWSELRAVKDENTRAQIIEGVSRRMAELYQARISGATVEERMESLAACLNANDVMVSLKRPASGDCQSHNDKSVASDKDLPVLVINGCPYPGLAGGEQHDICDMEQAMFSNLVGIPMALKECKCHSPQGTCTFVVETPE